MNERPLVHVAPGGAASVTMHSAPTRTEILEAQHSKVMAEKARDRETIRQLKKLLLREMVRHRKAGRYTNAKDIESSLRLMERD